MANVDRIKRRLLREAVDENVFVIRGGVSPHSRRAQRYALLRRALLVALPVVLLAVSYVATRVAADWGRPGAVGTVPGQVVVERTPQPPRAAGALALAATPVALPAPIDRSVLPLSVRSVLIDPGHGGEHRGTASVDGEMLEKDLTLDIGRRLREMLEEASYEVAMTREADVTVSLDERGELANRSAADIFVSIHVNWLGDSSTRGVETFYLGPTDDPVVERKAARENADGGIRLGEFRNALERVYADVRRGESRSLAESVQRSLLVSLRTLDPEIRNRGVKSAPFAVLLRTEMPAILAEVSCLSNEEEARQLRDPAYRQYLAEALFQGIRSYSEALNRGAVGS